MAGCRRASDCEQVRVPQERGRCHHRKYLGALTVEDRAKLEQRLASRQSGRCFICDDPLDLVLQKGQLDVDHLDPLAEDGLDAENNFALTHQSCNRSKGAANLHVARRIKEFERLQEQAQKEGKRGANLGDVLARAWRSHCASPDSDRWTISKVQSAGGWR